MNFPNTDISMSCTFGTLSTTVSSNNSVLINGKPALTINNKNIGSFAMCRCPTNPSVIAANGIPQKCNPQIAGGWLPPYKSDCLIDGNKTLLSNSKLACAYGGIITFSFVKTSVSDGATKVSISEKKEDKRKPNEPKPASNQEQASLEQSHDNKLVESVEKPTHSICKICRAKLEPNSQSHYCSDSDVPTKVKSHPERLKCHKLRGEKIGAYKTANHHIIPVNEAYNKFNELVIITLKAGYDINSPHNGIALPTPIGANPYSLAGISCNFGELDKLARQAIAFRYMFKLGLQWHSGGHSFDGGVSMSYSKVVVSKLTKIEASLLSTYDKCDLDEIAKSKINNLMLELEKKIKFKLTLFRVPTASSPYYVSKLAMDYATAFELALSISKGV